MSLKGRTALFFLGIFLMLLLDRKEFNHFLQFTLKSDLYSYIPFIPFLSAYFLFEHREKIFKQSLPKISWFPGSLFFLASIFLFIAQRTYFKTIDTNDQMALAGWTWLMATYGLFITVFGWSTFKKAFFPMSLLLFFPPLPTPILNLQVDFLRDMSEEVVAGIFHLLNVPFYRENAIFELPHFTIYIASECSGIRSTMSLWILAYITSYLFLKTWRYRLFLLLSVLPVSIFKNGLRIVTLALLAAYIDPIYITNHWLHHSGGIVFFIIGLILFFLPYLFLLRYLENGKTHKEEI